MFSPGSHAKDKLDAEFKRRGWADSTTKHVSKITWTRFKAKIVPCVWPVPRCVCFSTRTKCYNHSESGPVFFHYKVRYYQNWRSRIDPLTKTHFAHHNKQ